MVLFAIWLDFDFTTKSWFLSIEWIKYGRCVGGVVWKKGGKCYSLFDYVYLKGSKRTCNSTIPLCKIKLSNSKLRNFAIRWSVGTNKIMSFGLNRAIVVFRDIAIGLLVQQHHSLSESWRKAHMSSHWWLKILSE